MDLHESMEGHPVTLAEAKRELRNHGAAYYVDQHGRLWGDEGDLWYLLPLGSREILEWLGY